MRSLHWTCLRPLGYSIKNKVEVTLWPRLHLRVSQCRLMEVYPMESYSKSYSIYSMLYLSTSPEMSCYIYIMWNVPIGSVSPLGGSLTRGQSLRLLAWGCWRWNEDEGGTQWHAAGSGSEAPRAFRPLCPQPICCSFGSVAWSNCVFKVRCAPNEILKPWSVL